MAASAIYNPTPISDGNQLMALAMSSVVNLANPSATSLLVFAVPAMEAGTYTTISVSMLSSELIDALDAAAVRAMQVPNYTHYNGQYDANTARLMALYGSWTRGGADVGEYFLIGPEDVYNLLAQDPSVQEMWVNNVLRANGFQGISGNNGVPLIQNGLTQFFAPSKESIAAQAGVDPSTVVGSDEVVKPPTGYETVRVDEDGASKWWLFGGIAAAGLASFGLYKLVQKGRR